MTKKKKLFNGKPISHWNNLADELVMNCLVSQIANLDERSIIGKKAKQRLLEIALKENPDLYKKTIGEREAWQNWAMLTIFGPPKKEKKKKKIYRF